MHAVVMSFHIFKFFELNLYLQKNKRKHAERSVFGESNVVIDEQSIELLCFQFFVVVYTSCYISYGQTFAANYLMAHNSVDTCCIVGRHTGVKS